MIAKKNLDLVVVAIIVLALIMYDVTFDLCMSLLHFAFEVLHNLFEWLELGIEHAVEHLFHTNRHGSQIVTFYVLCLILLFIFWRLWKILPRVYRFFADLVLEIWARRKTQMQLYWRSQTLANKVAITAMVLVLTYLASFFVM